MSTPSPVILHSASRLLLFPPVEPTRRTITVADVARVTGWSLRTARNRLIKSGAAEKRGRRWVVTPFGMAAHFPQLRSLVWDIDDPATSAVPGHGPLLTIKEVAKLKGWPTHKTRRWLQRARCTHRVGGRLLVDRTWLPRGFRDSPGERLYQANEVAVMLGWDIQRARRWLRDKAGGRKHGGRWVITESELRANFRDAMPPSTRDDDDE